MIQCQIQHSSQGRTGGGGRAEKVFFFVIPPFLHRYQICWWLFAGDFVDWLKVISFLHTHHGCFDGFRDAPLGRGAPRLPAQQGGGARRRARLRSAACLAAPRRRARRGRLRGAGAGRPPARPGGMGKLSGKKQKSIARGWEALYPKLGTAGDLVSGEGDAGVDRGRNAVVTCGETFSPCVSIAGRNAGATASHVTRDSRQSCQRQSEALGLLPRGNQKKKTTSQNTGLPSTIGKTRD
jgi:hypothetical protein